MATKRKRIVTILLVVVVVLFLFDVGMERVSKRKIASAKAELQSDIQRNLPLSSSPEDVMSFLDKHHIMHSQLITAGNDEVSREVIGAPSVVEARTKISTFSQYSYSLHVVFKFDESHKLISHQRKSKAHFSSHAKRCVCLSSAHLTQTAIPSPTPQENNILGTLKTSSPAYRAQGFAQLLCLPQRRKRTGTANTLDGASYTYDAAGNRTSNLRV